MRRSRWYRTLRRIVVGVLALVLVLLAGASALLETETGSRWLVQRLASLAGLEVQGISGNLREGLDVASLEYRDANQAYAAQGISFRWRPVDMLYGALAIQSLRVQSLYLQPPAPSDAPAPTQAFNQWPALRLPLRIQVQQLRIKQVEWRQGENVQRWESLKGSLSWGTFHFRYTNLALVHKDYRLLLTGMTALDYPYKTQASLQWQWQPAADDTAGGSPAPVSTAPGGPAPGRPAPLPYIGVSELEGDLTALSLTARTSAPVVIDATVSTRLVNAQRELLAAPHLDVRAHWQRQMLPAPWWIPGQPQPVTSAELTATGNWLTYQAQLRGDIQLPDAPMLGVSAAVTGDLEKLHIDQLQLRERYPAASPVLSSSEPANMAGAQSAAASSAPLQDLLAGILPGSAAASSSGIAAPVEFVDTDAGLTIQGDIRWSPTLEWQLGANAEHLNIASLLEDWPSNINARFSSRGRRDQAGWDIQLQDLEVGGDLRGANIQGGGSLAFDGERWQSDELSLVLGANQVHLKGKLGRDFDLEWSLDAPLLSQIDSGLKGSLASKGHLRGDLQKPRLDVEASARNFAWREYGVTNLTLSLAPRNESGVSTSQAAASQAAASQAAASQAAASGVSDSGAAEPGVAATPGTAALVSTIRDTPYQLGFTASQLRLGGHRFSTFNINGLGSINQHQLEALVKHSGYGRAEVKLAGEYRDSAWTGKFAHLALKVKKVPRWWLTSSQPLRVHAQGVSLGRQCFTTRTNLTGQVERIAAVEREQVIGDWSPNQSYTKPNYDWLIITNPPAISPVEKYSLPQLCLGGDWARATGATLDANLDSVPLRQFLSLFKTEVFFAGVMDGSVHLRSDDLTLAGTRATARLVTRNAELRYQYAGGTTEVYPWHDVFIRATLEGSLLALESGMEWTGFGQVAADGELDLAKQQFNRTRLTARFSNLAPLETLLPFANDVKGDLRADLSLAGSFGHPNLAGEVSLRNGAANLPRLGLDLSDIDIQLNATPGGNLSLVSQLQSGKGRLSLSSDLQGLGSPDWRLQGFINGDNVQVVALPELKATLSPDIKITADPQTLSITGSATIPWARSNFKSLPESATAVSSDVVILDEQFQQAEPQSPMVVVTDLDLAFGEDVRFKGFGLNSKLSGRVKLLKEPGRQFFTSGYVSVDEGTYKAYGQTLTVDRGRLLFQGPYENPGLEIRASRIIRDENNTRVGLDISGTLQRPKATVFSSESLSESQEMMMLLTGKPLNEATKADASLLLSAMGGLGMDSGGSITSEITRFFRLDELEIKSDQGLNQSELWMGKYLTPRLLVRYVVGIFDQAFKLGMEYQLTDRLRLEAESGETQSVDVVYKIER